MTGATPRRSTRRPREATDTGKKRVDKVDLLILKELSKDGGRSLMEVQAAIKRINGVDINYKTLGWHYAHHVLNQRWSAHYSVGWHRLNYDFESKKDVGFARIRLPRGGAPGPRCQRTGKDDAEEPDEPTSVPLVRGRRVSYFSQLFIPLSVVNEALEHFKKVLKALR